jgi:hypothetical protein
MSEEKFMKGIMQLGYGIELCLENRLHDPAQVLIYSAIDVVSWLASPEKYASKASFIKWVEAYLLPGTPIKCTALDLYAARCGILHTLTPEARPIPHENPRLICYATGDSTVEGVQRTIELSRKTDRFVAVHINDLYKAWRLGLERFSKEIERDPGMKLRAYSKARKFFSRVDKTDIEQTVSRLEGKH